MKKNNRVTRRKKLIAELERILKLEDSLSSEISRGNKQALEGLDRLEKILKMGKGDAQSKKQEK